MILFEWISTNYNNIHDYDIIQLYDAENCILFSSYKHEFLDVIKKFLLDKTVLDVKYNVKDGRWNLTLK